jgi:polysaccharide export outer membrane protein
MTEGETSVRRFSYATLLVTITCTCALGQIRDDSARTQETISQPLSSVSSPPTDARYSSPYSRDAASTQLSSARVSLGAGDLLEIAVFDTPELTQRVRVNSDGKIGLALIGEMKVQDLTPLELEKQIRDKLVQGRFVRHPQVSVFVLEYAGQMVYVSGEVNHPGAYPVLRAHRLQNLLTMAGGMSSRAGNQVSIVRGGDSAQTIHVDLSDKDESVSNPEIMPGDNITVAQTGIVYVLGEVGRPGGFLLDRHTTLSVSQAVALAEGTKENAALSRARLIREVNGQRQETAMDLRAILRSHGDDPLLQAGDIIYIPGSATRGLGRRSIETILATASGAAIYASYTH